MLATENIFRRCVINFSCYFGNYCIPTYIIQLRLIDIRKPCLMPKKAYVLNSFRTQVTFYYSIS